MALQLGIEMLLGGKAEAEIGHQAPAGFGTSSALVTAAGSRIDTQPMPMPSARAASHRVWMAATTE